jgi:hypothetical protein
LSSGDDESLDEEEFPLDFDAQEEVDEDEVDKQDESKVLGPPTHTTYKGTFTNVEVKLCQTFGQVLSRKEKGQKVLADAAIASGSSGERSVVARGLASLQQSLHSGHIAIRDCQDANMPEYEEAILGFEISDEDWGRQTGWGRRAEEKLDGDRYLARFRDLIIEIYNAGSKKSALKKGPTQIVEEIEEAYPGIYRYPGEHDIAQLVSSLFSKEKKTGELLEDGNGDEGEEVMAAKYIPLVIDEQLRRLIGENPGETGKKIADRLEDYYRANGGFPQCFPFSTENRKHVMSRVNYLRSYQRQKEQKAAKRRLIG